MTPLCGLYPGMMSEAILLSLIFLSLLLFSFCFWLWLDYVGVWLIQTNGFISDNLCKSAFEENRTLP